MRMERADSTLSKGWYVGPWNSDLTLSIGYANVGIDEPHLHTQITEIYMVAHGNSFVRIEQETISLCAGDVLIVEPGEAHTFTDSSSDYFHFVLHTPGLVGEQARAEKVPVARSRLGL